MTSSTSRELPSQIYSEAIVRPVNGRSLLSFRGAITSENVHQFYGDPERIDLAANRLEAQGFEVLDQGRISITIRGSPELYEQSFNARLTSEQRPVIKAFGCQTTGTFISAAAADRFGFVDTSQSLFADVLDGVAINEPIYYFDANTPAADPPCPSYWHLTVPSGIAHGLNAEQAHREGVTGCGVKVVMVDTGWYSRHPFFEKQRYHAEVVLAPGVVDREDNEGHGTGESANLFAVAPGIEFTMVKADVQIRERTGNVNSIAALKKAISLQPDIISCSWGTNCTEKPLSPYEQILEATIADAVRQGIIVIFAAGNGHYGFPAQHPEVIAAGGVYMDRDGSLEASDYTSGFVSPIYPERFVPDVCGLVGKPPRAAYIMLPVPPGSWVDQQLGSEGARYPDGDETAPDDGWAAFSGTSAAAPQLAGVCALIKQANPELSTPQVKQILQQTSRDVSRGCCSRYTGSKGAGVGFDLATGYGLVDAFQAVMKAQTEINNRGTTELLRTKQTEEIMNSGQQTKDIPHDGSYGVEVRGGKIIEYPWSEKIQVGGIIDPILRENLEELLWEFDKTLQDFMRRYPAAHKVELGSIRIVPRSELSEAAATLREQLKPGQDLEILVSAAEGLLRIGCYQKQAIHELMKEVVGANEGQLIKRMASILPTLSQEEKHKQVIELKARALKALGKIDTKATAHEND